MPVARLNCCIQTYAWGKPGTESKVAQLGLNATKPAPAIHPTTPYAELWMGTHPNAPSTLHAQPSITLKSHLSPENMTARVFQHFNGDLPFLFKVLSVDKALSIQAHPDKPLAERLHAERPDVYKDDNHKPEMAIALTPFEGLCGFRSLKQIAMHLEATPELFEVCQPQSQGFVRYVKATGKVVDDVENSGDDKQQLKQLFHALMTADQGRVKAQLDTLMCRINGSTPSKDTAPFSEANTLAARLHGQYPGDVGVFCAFLLNHVRLEPGQAMFLAANEPHAYIHGDCIECMATSDNVVRAGLTPKLKDVETLVEMLTYRSFMPSSVMTQGQAVSAATTLYKVPIPEFTVMQVVLSKGGVMKEEVKAVQGPSILICVEGEGTLDGNEPVKPGCVYFVPAGQGYTLQWTSGNVMRVFQAYCELP